MSLHRILPHALRAVAATLLVFGIEAAAQAGAFLPELINSSTIPANGDVNPYGVAFVPGSFPSGGRIAPGDVLVANFNNSNNVQGTGTTIVQTRPNGIAAPPDSADVFFTSRLKGLSTALGVLSGGFVVVGNVPTTDGTFATIGQGALQIIDRWGHWVATWTDPKFLDGPWDLAIDDEGYVAHIFVSNVLNGTVSRLDVTVGSSDVKLMHKTQIATGYTVQPNAAAVVLGPTGLAFDASTGTLYVASTADNAIYAVANAAYADAPVDRGVEVFSDSHLRGPLALRFAPNGHLLTTNGDAVNADTAYPSEIIEFTKTGHFVRQFDIDASQGGAFGFDTVLDRDGRFNFALVDDVTNNLVIANDP